jgi:hypothetical protein
LNNQNWAQSPHGLRPILWKESPMSHENHHVVPGNGQHEYSKEKGYVAKEHEHQEYPKVVEHEAGKEPVVVHSEEQERAHKARKLKDAEPKAAAEPKSEEAEKHE